MPKNNVVSQVETNYLEIVQIVEVLQACELEGNTPRLLTFRLNVNEYWLRDTLALTAIPKQNRFLSPSPSVLPLMIPGNSWSNSWIHFFECGHDQWSAGLNKERSHESLGKSSSSGGSNTTRKRLLFMQFD